MAPQTNRDKGIEKQVSEPVYPSDILSDTELRKCSLLTRGLCYHSLFIMWRDKTDRITGRYDELARLFGCDEKSLRDAVTECNEKRPFDVSVRNGHVTLICRRLQRRHQERANNRKRAEKSRKKRRAGDDGNLLSRDNHGDGNGSVTPTETLPSSSSSSSPSMGGEPPVTKGGRPRRTILDMKDQITACREEMMALAQKYRLGESDASERCPNAIARHRKLRARIKRLQREIADYGE